MKIYPPQEESPYKLPWKAGISRFVAQGNRSFTSHRDFHQYAWDFVMANGTEILAVRDGKVVEIEDTYDGIGYMSNFIIVEHKDGTKSAFAHIKKGGALVKISDFVKQGQPIALSGMVGQTIFPHVHFYVIGKDGNSSIPVSFREVPSGVPFAGHIYTSQNDESSKQ
ncbi:MAG: M23 family metallopeptidase [Bdellovibrionales bacterium]|nr:M23 family metallopeptidase [Bdellovibrionales bacterium]